MFDDKPGAAMPTYQKAILQTVVYKRIRESVNRVLKQSDLNTTQWMVLGLLQANPDGLKISSIARILQVEVPLITTLAQALVRGHFAEQITDERDRRSKPLKITSAGQTLVSDVEAQLADRLKALESGLSDAQLNAYFMTLQTIISNAEQADQKI